MSKKTAIEYAKWICDTLMNIPAEELPPKGGFHYHQGVALMGMEKTYEICKDEKYFEYVKRWVDSVVDEDGVPFKYEKEHLDDLMAGNLLYLLYEKHTDSKYKKTLDLITSHIDTWRKNEKGGFWHKNINTNQMWLDGIFMYGPLITTYGATFGKDTYFDIVSEQMNIMWDNMFDEKVGLLRHAWDCSKEIDWANSQTGLSPEVWGRALGWYVTALMDIYEKIDDRYKDNIIEKELTLINSLIKYQNPETGMWYQVVDKLNCVGNWPEVSCTCLFVYAICKAINMGILDESYFRYALKGYNGVIDTLGTDEKGGLLVKQVCIGTGVGDYGFYIARPTESNDLHGIGAFLYMTTEMEKTQQKLNM